MCWHDGVTLADQSYILMNFSESYNPETHYRDDIHAKHHIEKLVLCLIAPCPATDPKLLHWSLRLTDIIELKEE